MKIDLLKIGNYTDANGNRHEFTRQNLTDLAESYDADKWPSPLVLGHPKMDSPAYGWLGSASVEGDTLTGKIVDLAEDVKTLIRNKSFRRISISIHPVDGASNPRRGRSLYIRHVGLLGAKAPAVPGLSPVSLSGHDDNIELSEDSYIPPDFALRMELQRYTDEGVLWPGESEFLFSVCESEAINLSEEEVERWGTAKDRILRILERLPVTIPFGEFAAMEKEIHQNRDKDLPKLPKGWVYGD
ncbi:MAG: hypothetical protein OXG90_09720 [Gammaproteobacteria bacterium]|nr:hypothetical protein [Gammaproteobacteria bacterium]MCY3689243.1 hypothetical protein [Gammaproteobacteria bacterium]